jgi:GT2 family glycosyltransferase
MAQDKADISVIICTYTEERWNDLVAAVESVQQQKFLPNEIIVVVDHNPILLERVLEHMPDVVVVENKEVQGLSGARNTGIAVAKSQLIAFLDDDAIATMDWLMFLCNEFADQQVLGVGGAIIPLWMGHKPAWLPEEFYWVVGCTYRGLPQTTQKIRNPIGANIAFRRELFTSVGGFRSGIGRIGSRPMGCEETELCIRAQQRWPQGFFLYVPQASVFHRVPKNRANFRYFCSRCYSEGLSKAAITRYVGLHDGLSSERNYIYRALSAGILRNIACLVVRGDWQGLVRAFAIIVGLLITVVGYMVGTVSS